MPENQGRMPAMERRFQPRAVVEIEAQYRLSAGGLWRPALIHDLSGGGTAAFVDEGLALGTALAGFRFLLPDEVGNSAWPLVVCAQVVRCVEAPDAPHPFLARFQFLPPAPREIDLLRRFVHRLVHGEAAAGIALEVPPHETIARASADNRLARTRELLGEKVAALEQVVKSAVQTEDRLRAEIRRLAAERPRDGAELAAEVARAREERDRLAGERDAAREQTAALRRRLAVAVERPLRPPVPVGREPWRGGELISLAAGLLLGALAVLGWQRFVASPRPGAAARPAAAGATAPIAASEPAGEAEPGPSAAAAAAAPASVRPPPPRPLLGADLPVAPGAASEPASPAPEPAPPAPEPAPPAREPAPPAPEREREPQPEPEPEPEPHSPPAAPAAPDVGAIPETVAAWAAAWTEQRAEDFLAFYGEGFEPPAGVSRRAWEEARRGAVSGPSAMQVRVVRLRHRMISDSRALVDLSLVCQSASLRMPASTSLELGWTGSGWKILREPRAAACRVRQRPGRAGG